MIKRLTIAAIALILFMPAGCASTKESTRKRAVDITRKAFENHWGRDWDKVIKLTTKAIEVDSKVSWPYSVRGAAQSAIGEYDAAISDFNRALELFPFFVEAYINRGLTYMRMGKLKLAEHDLSGAIMLAPREVSAHLVMAQIQGKLGNKEIACQYLVRAVENGFNNLDAIVSNEDFVYLLSGECYGKVSDRIIEMTPESGDDRL